MAAMTMLEVAGMPFGTVFQGGTMAAMFMLLAIVGRAWIVGLPERLRIANEAKITAAAELSNRYEAWRKEVHGLKNELQVVAANQARCDQALGEALATIRHDKASMSTMLFLIRLLTRELERKDPESIIVQQSKDTLETLGHEPFPEDKSTALATAEHTVDAAKVVVEEVKQSEEDK